MWGGNYMIVDPAVRLQTAKSYAIGGFVTVLNEAFERLCTSLLACASPQPSLYDVLTSLSP